MPATTAKPKRARAQRDDDDLFDFAVSDPNGDKITDKGRYRIVGPGHPDYEAACRDLDKADVQAAVRTAYAKGLIR